MKRSVLCIGWAPFRGDLTFDNVFLDASLNIKVADFSGSSLDELPLLVAVTASHTHPKDMKISLDTLLQQIHTTGSVINKQSSGRLLD
jgi:hypothetical protein